MIALTTCAAWPALCTGSLGATNGPHCVQPHPHPNSILCMYQPRWLDDFSRYLRSLAATSTAVYILTVTVSALEWLLLLLQCSILAALESHCSTVTMLRRR